MNLADYLRQAKALIDTPSKWLRGTFCNATETEFCALGATHHVCPYRTKPKPTPTDCPCDQMRTALHDALPRHSDPSLDSSVAAYNDHATTQHADIMALYDRAIKQAELFP